MNTPQTTPLSQDQIERLSSLRHRPQDRSLSRRLKFFIRCWQGRLFHPRFQRIKDQTLGMMYAPVYRRLYDEVYPLPDGDIVEVGAAAGSCTVVTGLARAESKRNGSIVSVEKFEGGSRTNYGKNFDENFWIFNNNLEKFGVRDRVKVFADYLTDENAQEVYNLIDTPQLVALIHDADGRIDRDFRLFYDRLIDGALIVIDDVVRIDPDRPIKDKTQAQHFRKFMITCKLIDEMERLGLLENISYTLSTAFCRKPKDTTAAVIDPQRIERLLQEVEDELAHGLARSTASNTA